MILRHRIYFVLWKVFVGMFCGIRKGVRVRTYSDSKSKWINGTIYELSVESCTRWRCEFDIYIEWDEPLDGNDHRYYIDGCYSFRHFISDKIMFAEKSTPSGWYKVSDKIPPRGTSVEIEAMLLGNSVTTHKTILKCDVGSDAWESIKPVRWRYPISNSMEV